MPRLLMPCLFCFETVIRMCYILEISLCLFCLVDIEQIFTLTLFKSKLNIWMEVTLIWFITCVLKNYGNTNDDECYRLHICLYCNTMCCVLQVNQTEDLIPLAHRYRLLMRLLLFRFVWSMKWWNGIYLFTFCQLQFLSGEMSMSSPDGLSPSGVKATSPFYGAYPANRRRPLDGVLGEIASTHGVIWTPPAKTENTAEYQHCSAGFASSHKRSWL